MSYIRKKSGLGQNVAISEVGGISGGGISGYYCTSVFFLVGLFWI